MANIDNAYTIDMLSLDDNILVVSGVIDPTVAAGYEAPIGSLYVRTNGTLYQKTNTADVDWVLLGASGSSLDELVKVSNNDTTAGYLSNKILTNSINLTLTENNDGGNETITLDTVLSLPDLKLEVDNIELSSGGIFNDDGTYNGSLVDITLNNVSASTNLLNTLSQLDVSINNAASPSALDDLTDVTTVTPANGQTLVYNSTTSQWENVTTTVLTSGVGRLLQVKFNKINALSGTVAIPLASTDPLISEGVGLWSENITPAEITSNMRISTSCTVSGSSNSTQLMFTFFRDSLCIGVGLVNMSSRTAGHPFTVIIYDSPEILTPVTYSCRIGKITGNTWYVNRLDDATLLNGKLANQSYTVEEIGVNP